MNRSLGISKDLLSNGFNVRIATRGSSMFPLIRTGDWITISPDKNPKIGDIIVLKRDDHMVCHRLVKTFEKDGIKYYQTRGDSFFSVDEPIAADQIMGRVIRIDREHISLLRRLVLLFHPVLRHGRLNSIIITALTGIKRIFS